ncbi:MAG: serine/threonine-protein kinase, partial [Nannocystaceae bacterium]
TLRTWQRHEPRPDWRACVSVYLQAGEGLAAAHHCDLVHRDFKPSNVLLDEQGRVRVLDFGLARSGTVPVQPSQDHSHGRSESTSARNSTWDRHLRTQTGVVMGTPGYMPPEQIGGRDVDARGDQFSFCVALYEAVYGQRPFGGQSLEELEQAILQGQVAPLKSRTRVPAKLEAVIMRGLSFEPDDRWPSMAALLEELRRLVAPRARRWVVGSVAVATLGLGGSWAFGHYLEIKDRCTGAAEQVAEVWGEDAGQRVKAAILGTELSYAPDTWAQVESRLDTYTEAWAAEHTDACEATQVRHEQSEEEMSLRMGCLHDRWVHLRATVGELGQADAKVVENAVRAVTSLPRLERCRDLEALAAEVRPPEDPAVAKQVEALEEVLAEAKAKQDAGKYDAGLHLADEVVKRGEPLGYEPLMARAWLRQGTLRRNAGDYEGAVTALKQAHGAALAQSMMAEASSASSDLMYVLGQLLARHEEAHRWSEHAEPLSRAAGETIARASYFSSLGAIADSQGEYEDARRFHERALAIKEKAMGPQHPTVATSLNNLGNAASALGDQEDARAALERALAIWKEAFGPGHPRVAGALSNLSTVAYMQGEYQDARAFLERALAISEQALGPRHINLAYTLNNLGLLASSQQEHEDARAFLERALAISEEALGPRHPIVATSLHNLGDVASSQEQYEDAQEFYERALAIFDEALDPQHPDHAFALTGLGNALIALDRPADALLPLERALSIRTTHQVEPVLLADTRFALARALWAAPADLGGDRPRARPLAEQARETYASLGDTGRDGLDEIAAWLTNHRLQ